LSHSADNFFLAEFRSRTPGFRRAWKRERRQERTL
jgi:hypothetical protein